MKNLSDYPRKERGLIVFGCVLIGIGVIGLVREYISVPWWHAWLNWMHQAFGSMLPVALVLLCVLLFFAGRRGDLNKMLHGPKKDVHRSRIDRRIFGACGGFARSRGISSTEVRLFVLLLFVAFPIATALIYSLLAWAMGPE